jgi:hypothetical protein
LVLVHLSIFGPGAFSLNLKVFRCLSEVVHIGGPFTIFGVFGGAVAIFVMVPFLLRGHWLGLLIAFLYWVIGYVLNPFWYLFPQEWQGSEREGPTVFLYVINILWWLIILIGTVAFYFTRRSAKYLALTPNQRA